MKTIEERAKEYENSYPNMDDSHYSYYVRDGYIAGATEQKKIDIEKACEWLRSHTNDKWVYNGNEYEGQMITAFRKAMEQ